MASSLPSLCPMSALRRSLSDHPSRKVPPITLSIYLALLSSVALLIITFYNTSVYFLFSSLEYKFHVGRDLDLFTLVLSAPRVGPHTVAAQ